MCKKKNPDTVSENISIFFFIFAEDEPGCKIRQEGIERRRSDKGALLPGSRKRTSERLAILKETTTCSVLLLSMRSGNVFI